MTKFQESLHLQKMRLNMWKADEKSPESTKTKKDYVLLMSLLPSLKNWTFKEGNSD